MSFFSEESIYNVIDEAESYQFPDNVKLDLHLNSPIRDTFSILFMDAIKLFPKKKYDPEISTDQVSYCELPPSVTGPARELISLMDTKAAVMDMISNTPFDVAHDVYNQLHSTHQRTSAWLPDKCKTITKVLHEIIQSYDHRLLAEFDDPSGKLWNFDNKETGLYVLKMFFEDIRDAICRLAETHSDMWELYPFPSTNFPVVLVSRSIILYLKGDTNPGKHMTQVSKASYQEINRRFSKIHQAVLVNYEFLLCMQDTIISRLFTLYTSRILSSTFSFRVPPSTIESVYHIFDKSIKDLGNDIYKQIKMFEAFINAHVIEKTNHTSMKEDFKIYLEKLALSEGFTLALELSKFLEKVPVHQTVELMGIFRHWGHPVVDEKKGCEKVKKIIRTRRPVCEKTMDEILGALNKQFVFEFISQMKRWPSCDVTKLPRNSPLRKMIDKNTKYINEYGNVVTLADWSKIVISSELEFDYSIDYLDLISDRAIAPWATENQYSYNSNISGVSRRGKPTTNRRLLTEVLDRETINIQEICKLIMTRSIPKEWFNIKLSSKERELGDTPRLFAMMPAEMRLAYCVMEKNIAKKVFNFYPQQSMNMGEEKISRRLINISTPRNERTAIDLIIGIDFTSWNIHWSSFNTLKISEMVSKLFGLPNLYEFCHEFFSMSEVSLSSTLLVPEKYMEPTKNHLILPEDQYLWNNHLGGLEGICQKLWTLITIGLLLVVESRTGIKSSIIGQGDNQVCKIQVPLNNLSFETDEEKYSLNDEHIRSVKDKFMSTLTAVAESIGLKLKALESWVSDSSAQYSKDWLIMGAYQSQIIKRINRTMPDVSEDYHTFPNRVSSLQSAGFSSAQKSYVMAVPWLVAQLETGLTLMRDLNVARRAQQRSLLNIMETESFFRFFFLSDNCFTGIPLVNLGEYEFRGHPDPLTTYLSMLRRIMDNEQAAERVRNMCGKIWAWLSDRKYPIGAASPELLISNPTAVNIKTPDSINYIFKQQVYEGLQNTSRNQDIKDMFNAIAPSYDKWFYQYLINARPCYPRLLNVIMTHSPTGARLYTISKLVNSKTVNRVTLGGVKNSLDDQITQVDYKFYMHLQYLYTTIVRCAYSSKFSCPTKLADDIRAYSFKDLMKGDPIVGVTVPHPMHVLRYVYDDNTPDLEGYISVLAPKKFGMKDLLTKGPQPPFVGTKTLEKVSGRVVTVSGKSRPFDDVCRLVQMLGWAIDEDSELGTFIKKLIACRTNVPFDVLVGMSGRNYIGSHIHRTSDPATKKDVRGNMRHSVTTHLAFSSDKLGMTTRGGDDFNIQPSAFFLHACREILKQIFHTGDEFIYLRGYLSNTDCCLEAYDNIPASSDSVGVAPVISVQNPLLYADIKDFQTIVIPDSCLVEYHSVISPADAIGYYLMSRYKGIILSAILSYQEIKPPYLTRISMSEVMNVGILQIIKSFAKYLYLYLESDFIDLRLNLSAMGSEVWCGIAELCLIPSVLPQICIELHLDGSPDVYKSNNQIHRLLNELLLVELDKIQASTKRSLIMKNTKFFVLDNVKFPNVLKMWWESICICYSVLASTRQQVFHMIRKMAVNKKSWGEAMNLIMDFFKNNQEQYSLWEYIISHHKIKLMKQPPEFYFRLAEEIPAQIPNANTLTEYSIPVELLRYIEELPFPVSPYNARPSEADILYTTLDDLLLGDKIDTERQKTRMDQSGRLIGNLSTAWCKYMQIVIRLGIRLHNPIICTADGESSVGIALSRYSGGQPIYYNSLQSRDIVTQRYEGFVPGSFICDRDRVKAQDLSLLYGGDLTDPYYLSKFLKILPAHPSLLTCDAETSGEFDPRIRVDIVNSLLTIVDRTKPEACIIKDFMGNLKLLSATISAFQLYYYSVMVVVPHYSSFESLECFIVARAPREITHRSILAGGLWVSTDHWTHIEHIARIKSFKILSNKPFADDNRIVRNFSYLGEHLGFHSNFISSLYRITTIYPPYNLQVTDLNLWLSDCRQMIQNNIISLCRSFGGMTVGKTEISRVDGAQLASNPSCSNLMQRYAYSMLSITALTNMIGTTDVVSAQLLLAEIISADQFMVAIKGQGVYLLTKKDMSSWAKQHLKPLWRVWGHHHHKLT